MKFYIYITIPKIKYKLFKNQGCVLWGSIMSHPQMCLCGMWLFRAKGNSSHKLKGNFHSSLLLPKIIWITCLANNRLSNIIAFDLSIGQGKLLFTKLLFFLSFCNDSLKSPRCVSSSLAQDVWYTSIPFLSLSLSCL